MDNSICVHCRELWTKITTPRENFGLCTICGDSCTDEGDWQAEWLAENGFTHHDILTDDNGLQYVEERLIDDTISPMRFYLDEIKNG